MTGSSEDRPLTPRVVAFVNGELGRSLLQMIPQHLLAVVVDSGCHYKYGPLSAMYWDTPWYYADSPDLGRYLEGGAYTHGICAGLRTILGKPVLDAFPCGILNVHTSLLPEGRGAHPNAWTIAWRLSAGVTLHLMDEGVDTGPLVAQAETKYTEVDTAATLQARLLRDAEDLMRKTIPAWLAGELEARPQPSTGYPTRRKSDLENLSIDASRQYHASELIDVLRARTYPPFPGAKYTAPDGRTYRVRVQIEEDR
jgi:methionyl-tRNA formyltransferase